ncbi:MAG: hypothetical protein ACOYZ7_19860 [Chloroflexota bacterium]
MDPIITPIVIILGKYALDKGVELGKEIGPKALETARELFQAVLERVGQKRPETAAEFPQDPETYHKPLEKALEAEVQADPDFAARLTALFEQYQQAAQEHAAASGTTAQVQAQDSVVAVGPGARAAGERAVITEGDVGGSIITGDHGQVRE